MSNNSVNNDIVFDKDVEFSSPNVKTPANRNLSPNLYSPSESLSRTTKARIYDSNELEKRKNTEVLEPKKINRNAIVSPPSDNLMKSTRARVCDMDALISSKGLIKHEDDPFWEQRKPVDLANNKKFQVDSKLYEPTTATIFYQRKKHPAAIPHHKSILTTTVSESTTTANTSATNNSAINTSIIQNSSQLSSPQKQRHHYHGQSIKPINPESPLLKKTFNSIIKDVKVPLPPPPPKPTLHLVTQFSSLTPLDVPSKLYENTFCIENSRWKNKEVVEKDVKHITLKTKPPSEHLLLDTKATHNAVRSKAIASEKDTREKGWSNSYKDLTIPDMDHFIPIRSTTTNSPISNRNISSSISEANKTHQSHHQVVSNSDVEGNVFQNVNINDNSGTNMKTNSTTTNTATTTVYDHEEEAEILEMQEMLKEMGSDQFNTEYNNNNESETY